MATKADIEKALASLAVTINRLLEALRIRGRCCLCGSPNGEQHTVTCPVWPMILARAESSLLEEGNTRKYEAVPLEDAQD